MTKSSLVALLPAIERDCLRRVEAGESQPSIARRYGVSQPAISARISKARRRLALLERYPGAGLTAEIIARDLRPVFGTKNAKFLSVLLRTTCVNEAGRLTGRKSGGAQWVAERCTEQLQQLSRSQRRLCRYAAALAFIRKHPRFAWAPAHWSRSAP